MEGTPSLEDAAAALLAKSTALPPRESGAALRPSDELRILVMVREQGATQAQAAEAVGCHQSTVSRVLEKYDDTRPLARKRLEAAALEVAERAIKGGDPLKLLAKLDVVRDDSGQGGPLLVVVGGTQRLAGEPDLSDDAFALARRDASSART